MNLPNTYTDSNETGCCAVPDTSGWDEKEITFKDKRFVRMYTRSFLYVPLNMTKVMTALQKMVDEAGASMPAREAMILSRDMSPWKAEQLYAVSKTIDGADNVVLNGEFLTKVFEGPYQNARKWYDALHKFASSRGKEIKDTYFFYTTCPKCAKHYGNNYVIGFASIS